VITAATVGGIHVDDYTALIFVVVGLGVFVLFALASRPIAHVAANQLAKRHVRSDLVVVSRRVVTIIVIGLGLFAALSFAVESANVALLGLILATIVAALGVQDLLRDYVSGYYILLERHIRVGDRISFDTHTGTITEVRLRVTLLRSEEGDVVVVPNSELFTKPITIHGTSPEEEEARKAPPK
jgi:small-conductance mechanosensitive channel